MSILVGCIPMTVLHGSLRRMLQGVCATTEGVDFWTRYVWIVVLMAPLLLTVLTGQLRGPQGLVDAYFVESTFAVALVGTFIALVAVGYMITGRSRPRI